MVGLIGGTVSGGALTTMIERVDVEDWYVTERFEVGDAGLALVHHGEKDPGGHTTWEGDAGAGVVYGAVSNLERLGFTVEGLFERLLDRPEATLQELSGPFTVAAAGRDGTLVAATDKLGTRECYYAETPDGLVFSSSLAAISPRLDEPAVDLRTVSDLVSFGFALGDKTLYSAVDSLYPSSILRWEEGEARTQRYWSPRFSRLPEEGYVDAVLEAYQRALGDASRTVEGEMGVWLSGGIDSRTMSAVLRDERGPFRTFTYDSNPPDASNLEPASRVAKALEVDHDLVIESPDDLERCFERSVRACDGMAASQNTRTAGFVFEELHDEVDVMMEAAPQGELFGEHIWTSHVRASSVRDAFAETIEFSRQPADVVSSLLHGEVDPDRSIREAVAVSDQAGVRNRLLDTWLLNIPKNAHFRGNERVRSQTGVRIPFADGDFLELSAGMADETFRRSTLPFTDGRIPRSMAPLKRELLVRLDRGLDRIPYQRTGVAPARPMALHDAAYYAKQLRWKLLSGRPEGWARWYRDYSSTRDAVDGWLDAARDRALFDADVVEEIRSDHLAGETNNWGAIEGIIDVEVWMQQALD